MKCPFDIHLRYSNINSNSPEIRPIIEGCSIKPHKLKHIFYLSPPNEWLNKDYPIFQITTPYVFFANKPIDIIQRFPRLLIGKNYPFRLIEGKFPIDKWKRPLSWAVEWIDTKKDIIIKRGMPWFDLNFNSTNIKDSFKLVKKKFTKSDEAELLSTKDITNYIKGTNKLMER